MTNGSNEKPEHERTSVQALRQRYAEILNEPVPKRLADLVERLRRAEDKDKDSD